MPSLYTWFFGSEDLEAWCYSDFQSMSLSFSIRMWKGYCNVYSRYLTSPYRVLRKRRFSSWSRSTVCDVGGKNCVWQSTDQERRDSKTASARWDGAYGSMLHGGTNPGDKSLGTPGAISGKTSPRSERTRPTWGHSWKTRYRKGTILILVSFAVDFQSSVPLRSPAEKRQHHRGFVLSSLRILSIWQLPKWPNLSNRKTQGLLTIFQLRDGETGQVKLR